MCWSLSQILYQKITSLPKIHKQFDNLPSFWPIIDTTGSAHYLTAKFLANLLKPLTTNQFSFDDSFDAARKIKNIPKKLFNCDYKSVSFDSQMYHYVKLLILF